jgi:Tol biopolymer transport system component
LKTHQVKLTNIMQKNILFLLISLIFLQNTNAQDKKKWDVNNPTALGGVPYSEVEFSTNEGTWMCLDVSPDGKTIAFDLLGDLYTMPITGGTATCIRSGLAWEVQPRFSPNGQQILFTSDAGGGDNIWVMQKDGSKSKQITKESFRLLNNAAWMPDGNYIVARKHFTSGRSLGAGEMWMYHISGGDGLQLTKKKNDQQDVNEPVVSPDGRYVYFSEDMYGGGSFQYNKNPNKQIFAIRRYDREEGKVEDITGGSGGACRPQLSPDGQWLAFVRRVETKTVLFLHNLASGDEFSLYDGLDKDQQEAWSIFGCYPGFDWAENGNIYITAGGKIKKIEFTLGETAVRSPDNSLQKSFSPAINSVSDVPFTCNINTKVAETLHFENKVFEKTFTANAIRNAVTSPDGKTLVFNAAGQLYQKSLPNGKTSLLLKNAWKTVAGNRTDDLTALQGAYEPTFSADGKQVAFVFWDDEQGGGIRIFDLNTNEIKNVTDEKGIYRTPTFAPDGKKIAFRRQDADDELGNAYTKKPGIYHINTNGTDLKFVTADGENPIFSPNGMRIYVNTGGYLFGSLEKSYKSFDLNGFDEKTLFKSKYANQWSPSPDA